jgi:hypothetical protein
MAGYSAGHAADAWVPAVCHREADVLHRRSSAPGLRIESHEFADLVGKLGRHLEPELVAELHIDGEVM